MRININFFKVSSAIFILCSGFLVTPAMAGNYGVQVGVFRNVSSEFIQELEAFDAVTTVQREGLTRVIVGDFDTISDANIRLEELQNAGFSDAFVRNTGKARAQSSSHISTNTSTNEQSSQSQDDSELPHYSPSEQAKWDSLSPSQQLNAVLLNGKLHLKQGDKFIPIKQP
jgi:hypothetical protein